MSPEQARGDEVDGRSDLYAAGVILYQLVTGDLPFTASSPVGILSKHLSEPPEPPSLRKPGLDLPATLEGIILQALAKEPGDRPQTADELRGQLRAVLADLPEHASGSMPAVALWTPLDRGVVPGQPTTPMAIRQTGLGRGRIDVGPVPSMMASAATTTAVVRSPGRYLWSSLGLAAALATAWLVLWPAAPRPRAPAPSSPPAAVVPASGRAPIPTAPDPVVLGGPPSANPPAAERPPRPDRPRRVHVNRRVRRAPLAAAVPAAPVVAPAPPAGNTLIEAERLLAQGEVVSACEKGEAHRLMHPQEPRVHRFLGRCYMRAGQPERARASFRRYLELAPEASDAAFIKSIVK